jgi:hypothetical protein
MRKLYMKHKWISRLELVPIPKLSQYNMLLFQNPKSETLPVPSISDKGMLSLYYV